MIIDRTELQAQMLKKHYSRRDVAELLGISYGSFHSKLHGKEMFKENEIKVLVDLFSSNIFFENVCNGKRSK